MESYKRLSLYERQKTEEGLDQKQSIRCIAEALGRAPSTVAREVKTNRIQKTSQARKKKQPACKDKDWCDKTGICEKCAYSGARCAGCSLVDCKDRCESYIRQGECERLHFSPWVCNGCRKQNYGCNRPHRMLYLAKTADTKAVEVRSKSRQGFDMNLEKAERIATLIKEGFKRGLSPYEISVAYAGAIDVSESTMYRMVEAGVGGLANIELARKVAMKPRNRTKPKRSTRHAKERNYNAFLDLGEDICAAATEMDCMEGRKIDTQAVLTLYNRPSRLQIPRLLAAQNSECVERELNKLKKLCSPSLWSKLFSPCICDNGGEFCNENALDDTFGGNITSPHLYYCDPGKSCQRAGGEGNHSELRQILPKTKVKTPFDELDEEDIRIVGCHANSNPRKCLGGKNPIQMFITLFGQDAKDFLTALGTYEIGLDAFVLTPEILDIERAKRNMPPLNWKR